MDGSEIAVYVFQSTDEFPLLLNLNSTLDGLMAIVTSASRNISDTDITSTLSVNDVTVLNGATLECEGFLIKNVSVQIHALRK